MDCYPAGATAPSWPQTRYPAWACHPNDSVFHTITGRDLALRLFPLGFVLLGKDWRIEALGGSYRLQSRDGFRGRAPHPDAHRAGPLSLRPHGFPGLAPARFGASHYAHSRKAARHPAAGSPHAPHHKAFMDVQAPRRQRPSLRSLRRPGRRRALDATRAASRKPSRPFALPPPASPPCRSALQSVAARPRTDKTNRLPRT